MSTDGVERRQTVVFLRHGVAQHNMYDQRTGQRPDLQDPYYFDPPLLPRGKVTAVEAGEAIDTWFRTSATQSDESLQLIVTSPLTRCLQTSMLAFVPPHNYQRDVVPTFCVESVREAFGMHYPDKRRDKSLLQKYWPMIQFDPSMTEQDELWKVDEREHWSDVQRRVRHFFTWLCQRPENNIVVVTHGVWMECCLEHGCPGSLGGKRVHNCDAFASICLSKDGVFHCLEDVRQIYNAHPRTHASAST